VKKPSSGDAVLNVVAAHRRALRQHAIAAKYAGHFGGLPLPPSTRWHWIELGTVKLAAHPYLRPALDRSAPEVLDGSQGRAGEVHRPKASQEGRQVMTTGEAISARS
jgi:hypothetical protein